LVILFLSCTSIQTHDAQLQHKLQTHIKKVAFSEIWIPPPNTHLSLHAQQSDLIH